jgi:AcrR family transcriptional regulator
MTVQGARMAVRMTEPAVRKPPGRPRSPWADRAILEATLELFGELGFEALTIEGVAERAGVGKTTIYRRWPSKEELVSAAVSTLSADVAVPETGSVRDDLVDLVRQMIRFITSEPAGHVLPRMASEMASGSPMGKTYVRMVIEPRRDLVAAALRRGVGRGELREDLDLNLAIEALIGPLIVRRMLGGPRAAFPRELPARLVDGALRGFARR